LLTKSQQWVQGNAVLATKTNIIIIIINEVLFYRDTVIITGALYTVNETKRRAAG